MNAKITETNGRWKKNIEKHVLFQVGNIRDLAVTLISVTVPQSRVSRTQNNLFFLQGFLTILANKSTPMTEKND